MTRPPVAVPVDLGDRRYDVVVGDGASRGLAEVVARRFPLAERAALVTDESVRAQPWFGAIDPGLRFDVHTVAPGERAKSLETLESLCRAFARARLSRRDLVVAVGGGVVSDLAGFAAATYHRGIGYCTVATTLLAQVDAAIGGKTGVDLDEGKNLVGAFWQPAGVFCDTAHLATLPGREWASGRGEVAKYALLASSGDPEGPEGTPLVRAPLAEQVEWCVRAKAAVVAADERETDPAGGRAVLNYGHTLAHALEAASLESGADLSHGEAVAIGLVFAALLARRLGRIGAGRVAAHRRVVERFGLSSRPGGFEPEDLLTYMARDKKAGHDLSFVLDGPRGVELVRDVPRADVAAALEELSCT